MSKTVFVDPLYHVQKKQEHKIKMLHIVSKHKFSVQKY